MTVVVVDVLGLDFVAKVTNKAAEIDGWVAEIMQQYRANGGSPTVVGVATERRPYVSETMETETGPLIVDYERTNKVATLQLCIDKKCLIIQLFYLDYMPQSLKEMFRSRSFKFVGDYIIEDTSELMREHGMRWNQNVVNHRRGQFPRPVNWTGFHSLYCFGFCRIIPDHPNIEHLQRCDWQARVLIMDQIELACLDALVSYNNGSA